MATATLQSINDSLEDLMTSYSNDLKARGVLENIKALVNQYLQAIPRELLLNLRSVLRLLVDVKSDNVQLWTQVLDLKESLGNVSLRLKASEDKLAIRQIYCALNEKMLRRAAAHLGMDMDAFWKRYKGSNIKSLQYRPELQCAWSNMQAQLGFGESPGEIVEHHSRWQA